MAFFAPPATYVGLDIGTSSLKVVELLRRRGAVEVATYAQANIPNLLTEVTGTDDDEIRRIAGVLAHLLDQAGVSTDQVIAALPSSVVFSTVLTLPDIPDEDMEKAVQFAARDVVPANLDEMVLGWSKIGTASHMKDDSAATSPVSVADGSTTTPTRAATSDAPAIPVFVTAAPKDVVNRYTRLMELLQLELVALEVETFPLVRSLLNTPSDSAMIVDLGGKVTTYHIIDRGTARVSHTIDFGGQQVTAMMAQALNVSLAQAEEQKITVGIAAAAPEKIRTAGTQAMQKIIGQAQQLLQLYARQAQGPITKTVLIGGGANLRGLSSVWEAAVGHATSVGDPWRGLAFPEQLGSRLKELGPRFAIAVGLAQRGLIVV